MKLFTVNSNNKVTLNLGPFVWGLVLVLAVLKIAGVQISWLAVVSPALIVYGIFVGLWLLGFLILGVGVLVALAGLASGRYVAVKTGPHSYRIQRK